MVLGDGEGVGSSDGVGSGEGVAVPLCCVDAVGDPVVTVPTGCPFWRFAKKVAAAQPRAGTTIRMTRNGHTFFHLDGCGRCMPIGMSSPARSNSSRGYCELTVPA